MLGNYNTDNCIVTLKLLLDELEIRYTDSYIENSVLTHPEYPSILCISDTLEQINIEILAIKTDLENLNKLPLPCIIQVKEGHNNFFRVLKKVTPDEIEYLSDDKKLRKIKYNSFKNLWAGVSLLVETTDLSQEPEIKYKIQDKKINYILRAAFVVSFSIYCLIKIIETSSGLNSGVAFIITIYTIIKLIGLLVSGTILWYEVDKYNPKIRSFCSGASKKINCDAVLSSKYATLFNGHLSLGLISFAYFFGTLSLVFLKDFSKPSIVILAFLSFLSLPIIFISAYYQGLIIKHWCRLCIILQTAIILESFLMYIGSQYSGKLDTTLIFLLFVFMLLPMITWRVLKPILKKAKEADFYLKSLRRLKNKKIVFKALLSNSREIKEIPKGLGISFHNESAKHNIIKICNPYCGPCSKAHPILEYLLERGKINLQILFITYKNDKDNRGKRIIKHLMSLDSKNAQKKTIHGALNEWYEQTPKSYNSFAKKYPIKDFQSNNLNSHLKAMETWCIGENINKTPSIFIDNKELPSSYLVEDLKDLLL